MLGGPATHCKRCKDEGMVAVKAMSRIINAHGVVWLRLMEKFVEHKEALQIWVLDLGRVVHASCHCEASSCQKKKMVSIRMTI